MKIHEGSIKKLCGRKGIRSDIVWRFLNNLTGNKEKDMTRLSTLNYNKNTIKACRDGIIIAYSGDMTNGKPKSEIV